MRKPWLAFCLLLVLAACAGVPGQPEKLTLDRVSFDDLPGWNSDRQGEAMPALARSCAVLMKKPSAAALGAFGKVRDWQPACSALAHVPPHDDAAARTFFAQYFQPYAVSGRHGVNGLFTGYYETELRGSMRRTKRYHVPLYARPRDLVTVDLGLFRPEWQGRHIVGKLKKSGLVPYDDRAVIVRNTLKNRARVLLWVDDPVDAFFLEIQGSGRARLTNGRIVRIGYDGANGHGYVAIGRVLADRGELEKPVTMQAIRAWLAAHPERAQEIMNFNPSYVFFKIAKSDGPVGGEGVVLAAKRSLAVDPAFVPLGAPLWLDTSDGNNMPLQRLVVAQDTGGAIKGSVRGDLFWGAGAEAEQEAGAMQSHGRYYLLLPKNAGADAED